MKKVLIITEKFPPINCVGGLRAAGFHLYLKDYGWNSYVLTYSDFCGNSNDNPLNSTNFNVVRMNCNEGRQTFFLRSFKKFFSCPQKIIASKTYDKFLEKASELILEQKIDMIWATAPSEWTHLLSSELSVKFSIPWVADFRDVPEIYYKKCFLNRLFFERLKQSRDRYLCTVSAITSVSKGLGIISKHYCEKKVTVILNGFDPEIHSKFENHSASNIFTILYAGTICFPRRDPRPFFDGVKILLKQNKISKENFQIIFLGVENFDIFDKYTIEIKDLLKIQKKRVSYAESIKAMYLSNVLLLLTIPQEKGIMTTKVFDYLASRRPILSVPSDNDCIDELLKETNAGISLSHPDAIANKILDWYNEWKQNGRISHYGIESKIESYSRQKQAGELSALLEKFTNTFTKDK